MNNTGKIIRNIDFPSCVNCVHYKPSCLYNDFSDTMNKCEKIATKDVVTDKLTYTYALSCRTDELLCGKKGKYFEREPRLWLKKIKHAVFRPVTFFYCAFVLYLSIYYIKFLL